MYERTFREDDVIEQSRYSNWDQLVMLNFWLEYISIYKATSKGRRRLNVSKLKRLLQDTSALMFNENLRQR